MTVTQLEIHSRRPFADGAPFGDSGPYERLDGTIHFGVDPNLPANQAIVDLDRAQRNADGRVEYQADFCLLQPIDPTRANRRLVLEVLNRGRKLIPSYVQRAVSEAVPTERIDPGDGFLLKRGWTMAWCGWQWDVIRSPALMGLEVPQALGTDGSPLQPEVLIEFQPNERLPHKLLANRVHHPYPAADPNDLAATLAVRDNADGPRTVIPRGRWRFARQENGQVVLDDSHVWLEGGFEPGRFYEVVYRARTAPVVGTGLLAIRDCGTFLRGGSAAEGNPCAERVERAYCFGVSQSGRFLRHFLSLGLNLDEQNRQVFDGLLVHVAGERRGQFNQRGGQPSDQSAPGFGHVFPFADSKLTDSVSGQSGSLLSRQRQVGGMPKVFYTNTSAEYWRGGCSLIHTDIDGSRDLEPAPEARAYLFASTQHGRGGLPLASLNPNDGCRGAHGFNAVDYAPLLRAAIVNMDRWVSEGIEPPASAVPKLADGSAVTLPEAIAAFPVVPGATRPDLALLPRHRRFDLGPDAERGVGRWPALAGEPYNVYVSAVDADGNELAGLRMPDVTVPVATYSGWNPRHRETGGPGQIIPMQGSTFPFSATAAERASSGDPRPSIQERYRDRADYLERVRAAAEALVGQRYLLVEDVETCLKIAAERYDAFAAGVGVSVVGTA